MLSKVEDHEKLIAELAERTTQMDEEFQLPTLDSNLDLDDWESGTEGLESKTPQEICTLLGIRHGEPIPYFNRYIDTIGVRDPWVHKQLLDTNVEDENRTALRAQWHQVSYKLTTYVRTVSSERGVTPVVCPFSTATTSSFVASRSS